MGGNMYQLLLILSVCAFSAYPQTTSTIRCRLCNRASTLSDCNKLVTCDATLEDCYMDELFTDQRTTVYEGGCRAKDQNLGTDEPSYITNQVCSRAGKRRRNDLVQCSTCCNSGEDCNKRLCGIKDDTINSSQCYSCDHRNSEQSEVNDPRKCVTLDTCQANEQCQYIMKQAYTDYQICVVNSTAPALGLTWMQACGSVRRSTSLCHSCCADGGCNYGTCRELNERIFKLADQGKFDFKTLKTT